MADKYRMQILDEKGQILKSETFYEIDNDKERTITLLPSEKELFKQTKDTGKSPLIKPVVDNILESRGLKIKFIIDYEKADIEYGILTITKKN